MITPTYCVTMARYNAWQNREVARAMETLTDAELTRDRGAFFGSILATCNHLLWGDRLWMSRFDGGEGPGDCAPRGLDLTPTAAVWYAERFRTDGRILLWAEQLRAIDLTGDLKWVSGALGRPAQKSMGLVITHMFNHQIHHRGQIHAMLTAAGAKTADTDLILMSDQD
ncbi:DinB family protein [Pseudooceanicola sp.]|uniref:DinB family protein n=1 Tax=Pseudooceanicola sp. TaxID=1914328 RepID=UPI002638CEA5|nr:DinB family protein [Pseudooceanicola sp.]MDF1854185.1 DinB family protein [Pseudooceanicola sp.]